MGPEGMTWRSTSDEPRTAPLAALREVHDVSPGLGAAQGLGIGLLVGIAAAYAGVSVVVVGYEMRRTENVAGVALVGSALLLCGLIAGVTVGSSRGAGTIFKVVAEAPVPTREIFGADEK